MSSENARAETPGAGLAPELSDAESVSRARPLLRMLSPRNIGAVYVWLAIILLFALLAPQTFPTWQTAKSILNQYSITGIAALSLVIPLAAGYYDLSIGYTLGLAGLLGAYLLQNTGLSPVLAILITLLACAAIGLLNAFVVVGLRVDSFIGTLGTGAILAAITLAISNDQTIVGRVGGSFSNIATENLGGVTLPVLYLVLLVLGLAWWLERSQMGRYFYAMGYQRESARLSGIRVDRLGVIAFVSSAVIAGFAGLVLAARVSSGSPEAGPPYLIPAFSAAFLGATQFRGGRFNPWGTIVAVLLLGTGDVGLLLAGGPVWTPQLFEGVVLIAAVALTGAANTDIRNRFALLRERWRSRGNPPVAGPPVPPVASGASSVPTAGQGERPSPHAS